MEQAIERARALIEMGQCDRARAVLKKVLALDPENVEALVALALADADDDAQSSLESAQHVLTVEPEHLLALLLAADAALELDRLEDAERYSRLAIAQAPWLGASHAVLAQAVGRRPRRYEEAKESALRAIELEPEEATGYVAFGNVELARGEWKRAEHWYRRALEVDPTDRTAQINLVTATGAAGRLSPALSEAAALLRLDPRDAGALNVLHETVYTTVVHLLWLAAVLLYAAVSIRSA